MLTKSQAVEMMSSDGMHAGPDQDKHAECLQASVNGLLNLGVNPLELFTKALQIIAIVRDTALSWTAKITAIFALFKVAVPPTVTMP